MGLAAEVKPPENWLSCTAPVASGCLEALLLDVLGGDRGDRGGRFDLHLRDQGAGDGDLVEGFDVSLVCLALGLSEGKGGVSGNHRADRRAEELSFHLGYLDSWKFLDPVNRPLLAGSALTRDSITTCSRNRSGWAFHDNLTAPVNTA